VSIKHLVTFAVFLIGIPFWVVGFIAGSVFICLRAGFIYFDKWSDELREKEVKK